MGDTKPAMADPGLFLKRVAAEAITGWAWVVKTSPAVLAHSVMIARLGVAASGPSASCGRPRRSEARSPPTRRRPPRWGGVERRPLLLDSVTIDSGIQKYLTAPV